MADKQTEDDVILLLRSGRISEQEAEDILRRASVEAPKPSGREVTWPEGFQPNGGIEDFGPATKVASGALKGIDEFAGSLANALHTTFGLPVDAVTGLINTVAGGKVIDPSRAFGGSQSLTEVNQGMNQGIGTVTRGVANITEGATGLDLVGDLTDEDRAAMEARRDSPSFALGEFLGEALPFVIPGTKVGAAGSIPARAAGAGAFAATEGAILEQGRDSEADQTLETAKTSAGMAASLVVLAPYLGRAVSSVYRRLKGTAPKGQLLDKNLKPTQELTQVLDEAGIDFDDLSKSVVQDIQKGIDPLQAERLQRFALQKIPATKAIITQDDILLGRQETLLGRTDEAARAITAPLRQRVQKISEAFEGNARALVEELGVPDDIGAAIKDALTDRRNLLRSEKNRIYRAAFDANPDLAKVPILPDRIMDALPDDRTMTRLSRIGGSQVSALRDALVEFGIDKNPSRVEKFLKAGNTIEPLNFENFEDFRQALNIISRADQSKSAAVAINPVLNVLDDELDMAFDAIPTDQVNKLDLLKQARSLVKEMKIDFAPEDLAGKLISTKGRSSVPTVDDSRVFDAILGRGTSDEAVGRLLSNLWKTPKGKSVINDLQAATVMRALDDALGAVSNKSGGQQLFSPAAFNRSLNKMGGKLKVIFADKPQILQEIRALQRSAQDVVTPATTKPKGSAPAVNAVLETLGAFGKLPVLRNVVDAADLQRNVSKSLKATPEKTQRTIEYVSREYPALASVLGVTAITGPANGDDD